MTSLSSLTFDSSCESVSLQSHLTQKGLPGAFRLAQGSGPPPSPKKWTTKESQNPSMSELEDII